MHAQQHQVLHTGLGGLSPPTDHWLPFALRSMCTRKPCSALAPRLRCRVFQTGKGIPISLSLVAVAVARRAGLQLEYVGSAGHFLTRLVPVASETGGAEHFLDAFSGTVMHMCGCFWPCAHSHGLDTTRQLPGVLL